MARKAYQNYPAPIILVQGAWQTSAQATLDATNCWATSFILTTSPFTGNINPYSIRVYFSNASGSPKVTPYIYSDNAATVKPNALVTNGTGVESGVLGTGYATLTWSGALPTLVVGTRYWIVLKVTSGTSIRVNTIGVPSPFLSFYGLSGGANGRLQTASGVDGAWAGAGTSDTVGFIIGITDGTDTAYFGFPINAVFSALSSTGVRIDGTQSIGTKLTIPSTASLRLRSLVWVLRRVGTPGNLSCVIYKGDSTTPLATSTARISTDIVTTVSTEYVIDFNPSVLLEGDTTYRIVLSAATGSNAANYYYLIGTLGIDTDATSVAILPWGNKITVLSGTTWTEVDGVFNFGIIPDLLEDPFVTVGGAVVDEGLLRDISFRDISL